MAKPSGPWERVRRRRGMWVRWYKADAGETPLQAKVELKEGRRFKTYVWDIYGPGTLGIWVTPVDLDGGITKSLQAAKRAADRAASLVR